ncbi:MAG: YidC/Oxa1 family membrane protein insertase [Patescibacteria group bacterium]
MIVIQIFNTICYQPLLNLLVFIYNVLPGHDLGVVIIVVTVIIRGILYPFSAQSIRAQKMMQEIQPKIDELKKLYKDQKEKQASEMMKLYKEQKINPLSSCLPLLIQLPFLLAIYQVFQVGITNGSLSMLYPFIHNPGQINTIAFGFLNLSKPQIAIALLAAIAQFFQAKMLVKTRPTVKNKGSKDEDMMAIMNKQMTYVMPVITFFIGFSLPGGLVFYWLVLTLLTILQQAIVFRKIKKDPIIVIDSNSSNKQ